MKTTYRIDRYDRKAELWMPIQLGLQSRELADSALEVAILGYREGVYRIVRVVETIVLERAPERDKK